MHNHQALTTCRHNMHCVNNHGGMMEMTLVLNMNPQCTGCKRKLEEVLHCIQGQYTSFTLDAETHKVKITGRVDPGLLMPILSRTDGHGEVALIQLNNNGDSFYDNYYKYNHHFMTKYGNPYNHAPQDDPYVYNGHHQAALWDQPGHYHTNGDHHCLCNIL